jgi:hypothetical protein
VNCLAFDPEIADIVAVVRANKLMRIKANYFPQRRKRKPRFCITTTISLCPRQRAKRHKAG